jgi:uncharacterized membrane protein YkoI
MFSIYHLRPGRLILLLTSLILAIMIPVAAAQDSAQTVELVGMIEAMSLNSITVNQQEVNTTQAEINVPLALTALVKVEGTLNEDGSITARQVNPAPAGAQPGEAELVGALESISGGVWVVNGQTIDVSAAQVTGTPAVGQRVRLHVLATGVNTWSAREAEIVPIDPAAPAPTPIAGEFEIVGTLQSISGRTLVVSGQSIDFISAEINDPLVIGTLVKVHVSQVNGVLVAREIELAQSDDAEDNGNANANVSDDNGNANTSDDNSNANSNDDNANTSANVAFTAEQAIAEVLRVYPNAQIRSIELTTRFGGTVVWEIKIAGRIELIIDAQTGAILTIDRPGGGSGNSNGNSNNAGGSGNGNSNTSGNANGNSNSDDDDGNSNGNDNSDDSGGHGGGNDNEGNSNN